MRSFFTKHNKAVAAVIFFIFFAFLDGPFLEADSPAYLNWYEFLDPGYPLFLRICKLLPGAAHFSYEGFSGVWYAVVLQSLLWAYATARFSNLTEKTARQAGCNEAKGQIVAWGTLLLQFAVCLLNRFASARGAMYSNSVLTEALTMPMYILFVCRLFQLLRDGRKRDLALLAVCISLMLPIRTQMLITLLVWMCAAFVRYLLLRETRSGKRFLLQFAVIVSLWTLSLLLTGAVNYYQSGTFGSPARRSEGMLCMLLYTADEADAELFHENEQEQKQWFLEIMKEQKARGARYADAPLREGWQERYTYFMYQYDVIGYEIVHEVLGREVARTKGTELSRKERQLALYEMEQTMVPALRRQDMGNYLRVFADNLAAGLVTSNARVTRTLVPVSVLFYAVYVALFVSRCFRRREDDVRLLAFLVITGLVINAVMVAPFVFSQPRYDLYSMAMFYAMLLQMAVSSGLSGLFPSGKLFDKIGRTEGTDVKNKTK